MTVTQAHFRFFADDNVEASSTPLGAEDANIFIALDTPFRVRWDLDVSGSGPGNSYYRGEYKKVGDSVWLPLQLSGAGKVQIVGSANIPDGGVATTQRLSGSGTFVQGVLRDDGNGVDAILIAASECCEIALNVQLVSANGAANGDQYDFRLTRIDAPAGGGSYTHAVTPGTTGNYFSTPDPTGTFWGTGGSFHMEWYGTLASMAADNFFVCKYLNSTNYEFLILHRGASDGLIRVYMSATGTGLDFADSGATLASAGITADTEFGLKVTVDFALGEVKFYTSAGWGQTWTQLGSTIAYFSDFHVYDGVSPIEIGTDEGGAGTDFLNGSTSRMRLLDAIDGNVVVDFNPNDFIGTWSNGSSWDSAVSGETWTGHGTAYLTA